MIFGKETGFLKKLAENGSLSATDLHLAEFLALLESSLSGNEKILFATVTALVSKSVADGNICLAEEDFSEFAGKNEEILKNFPGTDFETIKTILKKSSCCTENPDAEVKPIVLSNGKIYLYKYWLYEDLLAGGVLKISKDSGRYHDFSDRIGTIFDRLFNGGDFEQLSAAKNAVKHRFSLITGGPGTGKTTIIAKILVGISTLFPEERIMLAAPTGKAAARMSDALKEAVGKIRLLPDAANGGVLDKISTLEGTTIHRMLEWKFGRFSRNRRNPLAADLVIIDEAGMLDITLFTSLLDALGKETSLILLGDKDQLASVGAGSVLSDICSAAEKNLLPQEIVAKLEKSHRSCPGIIKLAKAVNECKNAKKSSKSAILKKIIANGLESKRKNCRKISFRMRQNNTDSYSTKS